MDGSGRERTSKIEVIELDNRLVLGACSWEDRCGKSYPWFVSNLDRQEMRHKTQHFGSSRWGHFGTRVGSWARQRSMRQP